METYEVKCKMNNGDEVTFELLNTFSDPQSEVNGRLLGKGSPSIHGKQGTEDCFINVHNISTFTITKK